MVSMMVQSMNTPHFNPVEYTLLILYSVSICRQTWRIYIAPEHQLRLTEINCVLHRAVCNLRPPPAGGGSGGGTPQSGDGALFTAARAGPRGQHRLRRGLAARHQRRPEKACHHWRDGCWVCLRHLSSKSLRVSKFSRLAGCIRPSKSSVTFYLRLSVGLY